jgi:hypothetical protein
MARRLRTAIDWTRVEHVQATAEDEKRVGLKLKPSADPFPRVTIITEVRKPGFFPINVYSWKNLSYPPELLNWVINDPDHVFKDTKIDEDKRVRVVHLKGTYNSVVKQIIELPWVEYVVEPAVSGTEVAVSNEDRPRAYMISECGDFYYPDTLALKHRAIGKRDCVLPNSLAFYHPATGQSIVSKFYALVPRNGTYWRRGWWNEKNSDKCVAIPYLGNCVTVGIPVLPSHTQESSVKFFSAFPPEVKKVILDYQRVSMQAREYSDDETE